MDERLETARVKVLTAYYDLAVGPVSYDVAPFLIRARMAMEDAGCEAMDVVIVPHAEGVDGMFRDKRNLYDAAEMHWRLWNLVVPCCKLAGARAVSVVADWSQAAKLRADCVFPEDWDRQKLSNKAYLVGPVVAASRAGRAIPRFRSSEAASRSVRQWFRGKPFVTITLRNTYESGRNSDLAAWMPLAHLAEGRGYRALVMQDTSVVLATGDGLPEVNMDLRMACYETAAMNLVGNNGPSVLLWFSNAPFIEFGAAQPLATWGVFWKKHNLIDVDAQEQLPWSNPDQKLLYAVPTAEGMRAEFSAWLDRKRAAA